MASRQQPACWQEYGIIRDEWASHLSSMHDIHAKAISQEGFLLHNLGTQTRPPSKLRVSSPKRVRPDSSLLLPQKYSFNACRESGDIFWLYCGSPSSEPRLPPISTTECSTRIQRLNDAVALEPLSSEAASSVWRLMSWGARFQLILLRLHRHMALRASHQKLPSNKEKNDKCRFQFAASVHLSCTSKTLSARSNDRMTANDLLVERLNGFSRDPVLGSWLFPQAQHKAMLDS